MDWVWRAIAFGVGRAVTTGIGRVIGHFIDSSSKDSELGENDVLIVLVACFLSRFAAETGHVESGDRDLVLEICTELGEPTTFSLDDVLSSLDEWGTNDGLFGQAIDAGRGDQGLRKALLTFGWRLASRDNRIDDQEVSWLTAAAEAMGASDEDLEVPKFPYYRGPDDEAALADARSVLGLPESATPQEIDKKYRQLSRKYHPDSHATADETLKGLAAEKFAKISTAYHFLKSKSNIVYWGTAGDEKEVLVPKSRELVRCFFCGQNCRLPEEDHFVTSRCPSCQALLLFEEDIARALVDGSDDGDETETDEIRPTELSLDDFNRLLDGFTNPRVFVFPDIPPKKLRKAIGEYASDVSPSSVLLLYDDTLFGGAREGFMLTTNAVYWHNLGEEPMRIAYAEINSVSCADGTGFTEDGGVLINGHKIVISVAEDNEEVAKTFVDIVQSLIEG